LTRHKHSFPSIEFQNSKWNRLRNKKNTQGRYNISSFLSKWVERPPRTENLAKALRNPKIQAALQNQGITITINDGSSIPVDGTFDTQTIRKEMKGLLDEPSFSDFRPHEDNQEEEDPTTIEKVCNTARVGTQSIHVNDGLTWIEWTAVNGLPPWSGSTAPSR